MNINQAFPSKYIKADDLGGIDRTLTVSHITMENVEEGKDPKPIVHFNGAQKGWVLNKTNAEAVSLQYGPETDSWVGKQITLYPQFVPFQGKHVLAIRVRIPVPTAAATAAFAEAQKPTPPAAPVATSPQNAGVGLPPAPSGLPAQTGGDLDDEIPF